MVRRVSCVREPAMAKTARAYGRDSRLGMQGANAADGILPMP